MCGIAVVIDCDRVPDLPDWPFWRGSQPQPSTAEDTAGLSVEDLLPALQRRGPDATFTHTEHLSSGTTLSFAATTLSLRGPPPTSAQFDPAPGLSRSSTLLLLNGEVYDGLPCLTTAVNDEAGKEENRVDAQSTAAAQCESRSDTVRLHEVLAAALDAGNDPLELLDALRGPWTVIVWHAATKRLYFGRDVLGRRSLLLHRSVDGRRLVLTSAAAGVAPSSCNSDGSASTTIAFAEVPPVGLAFLDFAEDPTAPALRLLARDKEDVLPPRAVGVPQNQLVSGSVPMMYVSFLPKRWLRGRRSAEKARNGPLTAASERADEMREEDRRVATARGLLDVLRRAVCRRVVLGGKCASGTGECDARLSLLFSGGVDSCVLAALLGEALPDGETLHLVNVAFGDNEEQLSRCADRRAAESAAIELRGLLGHRRGVQLHRVNVDAARGRRAVRAEVGALVRPCDRAMDATIGATLWFGARGALGRVVVSGCGADELLGGYKGRHRSAFARDSGSRGGGGGDDADTDHVGAELDADLARLWFRNLGRDDRLVGDCGRELRLPFLDEDVVEFVTRRDVRDVCDLGLADGVGDKRALRDVAQMLGLSEDIVRRPKRAMQFGSRSRHVLEGK